MCLSWMSDLSVSFFFFLLLLFKVPFIMIKADGPFVQSRE